MRHEGGGAIDMTEMIPTLLSEADYQLALGEIARHFEAEPTPGAPDGDRFDLLTSMITDYERKHWPIEKSDR